MDPRVRGVQPPDGVLQAWEVSAPTAVEGGQGSAFESNGLIFKPVLDQAEAVWCAETLSQLERPTGIRLIEPVPAHDGRWVVDGWCAWRKLEGHVTAGHWERTLEVSGVLHRHLTAIRSGPPTRHHPWAIADRFAWQEEDIVVSGAPGGTVQRVLCELTPVDLPAQVIHGDLLNNILFHPHLPPAVIDVSPYWRPARFADAIVVVDAVGWFDAPSTALHEVDRQLVLRAILFRLGAAVLLVEQPAVLESQIPVYERLADAAIG